MKRKIATGTISLTPNGEDFDIWCQYVKPTKEYQVYAKKEKICTLDDFNMLSLKGLIKNALIYRHQHLDPDLRIMANYFQYYAYDGIPSLSEIGVTTASECFIVLDSACYGHKTHVGERLTNTQIISRIKEEMKIMDDYLKNFPASYDCIYRKAYYVAWIAFLKKGKNPFRKE
jgi:hypothetical protein